MFSSLLARFWIGLLGAVGAGLAVFRGQVFDPRDPAFDCVTVGALSAGIFTLLRANRPAQAITLAIAYGLFRLGLVQTLGWIPAISGIVLGLGILVVALIFDLLARQGIRFGKFLIVGPLIGGLYLAIAPMIEFHELTPGGSVRMFLGYTLLGIVLGDGVGLGVEVAELISRTEGD